jgi:hypothetical protein
VGPGRHGSGGRRGDVIRQRGADRPRRAPSARRLGRTTTEPGGSSTVTSGDYSNDVRSADLFFDSDSLSEAVFQTMVFALMSAKTKSRRVAGCAMMAARHMDWVREQLLDRPVSPEQVEAVAGSRGAAVALMCLNLARLMAEIEAETPPSRQVARSACEVLPVQLKVRTERTDDGGYRVVPTGNLTDGTKALAVRTSRKGRGTKLMMHVAPKRKVPLSRVAGKNIVVSVASPPDALGDADVTVGFKGR